MDSPAQEEALKTSSTFRFATACAAALLIAGCGSTDTAQPAATPAPAPETTTPAPVGSVPAPVPSFVVANGKSDGPAQITAEKDSDVVFQVTSDKADEVHVHGYDELFPVKPGEPTTVRLRATLSGIFEVELENEHLLLTNLRIS